MASASLAAVRRPALGLRMFALTAAGMVGWIAFGVISAVLIDSGWQASYPLARHVDWHVYAAGWLDLVDRSLYRELLDLGSFPLAFDRFKLPPLSALLAGPFMWLPVEQAGILWQAASVAAMGFAATVLAALVGARRPWAWAGIGLGAYALHDSYLTGVLVGTNNYLVLAMLAAFAWQYTHGHDRTAGALLGLAVATKLWPIALVVLLVRERRWIALRWAGGVVALQAAAFLAWLGPDVVPAVLDTFRVRVSAYPGVIGPGALRDALDWWPSWGGLLLAVLVVAVPARGRMGLGLGILGGLLLVDNLWNHYLSTILFGGGLLLAGAYAAYRPRTRDRPQPSPVRVAPSGESS